MRWNAPQKGFRASLVQIFLRVIHASAIIISADKKRYRHINEHKWAILQNWELKRMYLWVCQRQTRVKESGAILAARFKHVVIAQCDFEYVIRFVFRHDFTSYNVLQESYTEIASFCFIFCTRTCKKVLKQLRTETCKSTMFTTRQMCPAVNSS